VLVQLINICWCPVIGPLPPQKSLPPADNLPAKIHPTRRPRSRDGFLPLNCRPGETFMGGVPIIYGVGDILIRGRHISFVGGFFTGEETF